MSIQSKTEKKMLRQAVPGTSVPAAEPVAEAPTPAEPIAQWQDTIGDRWLYLLWLGCFGVLAFYVVVETTLGFLMTRR